MYLEKTLTKKEKTIFLHWLNFMGINVEDIADLISTSIYQRYCLHVYKLNNLLGTRIEDYDSEDLTYKGEPVTIPEVIEKVYHKDIADIIQKLNEQKGGAV